MLPIAKHKKRLLQTLREQDAGEVALKISIGMPVYGWRIFNCAGGLYTAELLSTTCYFSLLLPFGHN